MESEYLRFQLQDRVNQEVMRWLETQMTDEAIKAAIEQSLGTVVEKYVMKCAGISKWGDMETNSLINRKLTEILSPKVEEWFEGEETQTLIRETLEKMKPAFRKNLREIAKEKMREVGYGVFRNQIGHLIQENAMNYVERAMQSLDKAHAKVQKLAEAKPDCPF